MYRDYRAEGWGPEDCYPEADEDTRSELIEQLGTWMPIKTAPKNGTPVLILFQASMHVEDGDWYYTLFDGECLNDRQGGRMNEFDTWIASKYMMYENKQHDPELKAAFLAGAAAGYANGVAVMREKCVEVAEDCWTTKHNGIYIAAAIRKLEV